MFFKFGGCCCCQWCLSVTGCNSNPVDGATVTVTTSGGSPVGSGATDGQVTAVTRTAGGSGYTDGTWDLIFTGLTPTTVATGTFVVSGGSVTSITLTDGGHGYFETPGVSFANAGAGTGASATVTAAGICCVGVPGAASYKYSISKTGYATATSGAFTTSVTCPKTTTGVALLPDATHACCTCWEPTPRTLTLTDANGAHSFVWNGVNGYSLCYDAPCNVCTLDIHGNCSITSGTAAVIMSYGCTNHQFRVAWKGTLCGTTKTIYPQPCPSLTSPACGFDNCGTGCSIDSVTLLNIASSPCTPFNVSLTLPSVGDGGYPSPVSGAVTITF